MRKNYLFFTIFTTILLISSVHSKSRIQDSSIFSYISPVPNSSLNPTGTTIILKAPTGSITDNITEKNISVMRSLSGYYDGKICRTDDSRIIIFKPNNEFSPGENV